jgi:site-specific recombinase XerD
VSTFFVGAAVCEPERAPAPAGLTLGELAARFFAWMERECAGERYARGTLDYYRTHLTLAVRRIGADRPVAELRAIDLEMTRTSWFSVQAPQRLFNWAVRVGLSESNPFRNVPLPPHPARSRVLSDVELAQLLRGARGGRGAFRRFLIGMRETLARPQEIRHLTWEMLDPRLGAFVLTDFKGKKRRRDGKAARLIPVTPRLGRLLERLRARQGATGRVFLNCAGEPWTRNAVRCCMRRLRRKLGWPDRGEKVVPYTMRHTGATRATANGVSDRRLADLMGHAKTITTARYQHLQVIHLHEALRQAQARHKTG